MTASSTSRTDFDGVPMDMAMHLLHLPWNRQHISYLLIYYPVIMDSLANNGPYISKLLPNSIFLQSSLYSDIIPLRFSQEDPQTVHERFYDWFRELLVHCIDKSRIPTVVALLTSDACLVPRRKQSAGRAYCGLLTGCLLTSAVI